MNASEEGFSYHKTLVVGSRWVKTLYRNLEYESTTGVYGEGTMVLSRMEFRICAIELFYIANCSSGRDRSVWRFPVKLSATPYFSNPGTMTGSKTHGVDDIVPSKSADFFEGNELIVRRLCIVRRYRGLGKEKH